MLMNKSSVPLLILTCFIHFKSNAQCSVSLVESLDSIAKLELVMTQAVDVNEAKEEAFTYIKLIEHLNENFRSEELPVLLFRAGDVCTGLGAYDKSIELWEMLIEQYPDHELMPRAIFFQGFVLDTKQQKYEAAKSKYDYFLSNFPDHELNSTAKMLLKQLGSSDTDLLNKIKSNKKQG